jgi:hypothetical protein
VFGQSVLPLRFSIGRAAAMVRRDFIRGTAYAALA